MNSYFTLFSLDIDPWNEDIYDKFILENSEAKYSIGESNLSKWFTHEIDLKLFSKRFPDYIFILGGEGQEAGDLWIKYFKDGKMQIALANITYDDFDEKKLK